MATTPRGSAAVVCENDGSGDDEIWLGCGSIGRKQAVAQLEQAAVILGLKPAPPPIAVAELIGD